MTVKTFIFVVADPENSAMSRLFFLALLASLASGWDRPLPGPVRAAAAHERGGLNPYHFFSVRHDRRKLEGEEEGKGEGLEAEEKKEIKEWTSTLCLMALGLTFLIGHTLESIHFDLLPEAGVGILLGAPFARPASRADAKLLAVGRSSKLRDRQSPASSSTFSPV